MSFLPSASLCSPQQQARSTLLYKVTERFNRTGTLAIWRHVWDKALRNMCNCNSILSHYTLVSNGIYRVILSLEDPN